MTSPAQSYQLKRYFRVVGSVGGIIALAIGVGIFFNRVFRLKNVEVVGSGVRIEVDKKALPQNLLFFPVDKVEQDIIRNYPLVSSVSAERRYPGTLIIHIWLRETTALLSTGGATYALDGTGVVLGDASPMVQQGYTVLMFDLGTPSVGFPLHDQRVQQSLSLIRSLQGIVHIDEITEGDAASLRARVGNTDIFIPQQTAIEGKASTLQTIIEGFRIKGTLPAVIDLRFDKPIITK